MPRFQALDREHRTKAVSPKDGTEYVTPTFGRNFQKAESARVFPLLSRIGLALSRINYQMEEQGRS